MSSWYLPARRVPVERHDAVAGALARPLERYFAPEGDGVRYVAGGIKADYSGALATSMNVSSMSCWEHRPRQEDVYLHVA